MSLVDIDRHNREGREHLKKLNTSSIAIQEAEYLVQKILGARASHNRTMDMGLESYLTMKNNPPDRDVNLCEQFLALQARVRDLEGAMYWAHFRLSEMVALVEDELAAKYQDSIKVIVAKEWLEKYKALATPGEAKE